MKDVKAPTSSSYQDYLISSLQNPEHITAYLEVFFRVR